MTREEATTRGGGRFESAVDFLASSDPRASHTGQMHRQIVGPMRRNFIVWRTLGTICFLFNTLPAEHARRATGAVGKSLMFGWHRFHRRTGSAQTLTLAVQADYRTYRQCWHQALTWSHCREPLNRSMGAAIRLGLRIACFFTTGIQVCPKIPNVAPPESGSAPNDGDSSKPLFMGLASRSDDRCGRRPGDGIPRLDCIGGGRLIAANAADQYWQGGWHH